MRRGQGMNKLSDEIVNSLAVNLREKIKPFRNARFNIEEIRVRVNKPLIINANNKDYFYNTLTKDIDDNIQNAYITTREDVEQTFQLMCKYSIHSFIDDIKKGIMTLKSGH
jgi:stage III sporulation protein AA